jgi:hypothetical protein
MKIRAFLLSTGIFTLVSNIAASEAPPVICQTGIADKETVTAEYSPRTKAGDLVITAPRHWLRGPVHRSFIGHAVAGSGATMMLMFSGYASDDTAPSGEQLVPERSILARFVPSGSSTMQLYLDGDVAPPVPPPAGFFVCQ